MGKVFVLGLDGATMDIVKPMIKKGQLPAFRQLMSRGAYGQLRSVDPPLSPPAWASFATGQNPGKNGIIGFTRMKPGSYELKLVSGQDNRSVTLWKLLSSFGKKVSVLNVPMTYPPEAVNGQLVSGLDTPDIHSNFTYPSGLKKDLISAFPNYKINLQLGAYLQRDRRRKAALAAIFDSLDMRYRVASYLMDNYPWDFFIVKFNNPDIVQHHFWKYMDPVHPQYEKNGKEEFKDAIFAVYRHIDRIISGFLEKLDAETTFFVMSDHGAGPRINKVFYVNEWLKANGYLNVHQTRGAYANFGLTTVTDAFFTYFRNAISFLFRNTSPNLRIFLKNMFPKSFAHISLRFKYADWLTQILWPATTAFMAEAEHIRIHRKGSYPQGVVSAGDYERFRNKLIQQLKSIRDPETDETVFVDVLTREAAFGMAEDNGLPDIQLVTRESKYDISGNFLKHGRRPTESFVIREKNNRGANGMHRPHGILFACGPHICPGVELQGLQLVDLFPTILYAMDLPIPTGIDGKFIQAAFDNDFLKVNPCRFRDYGSGDSDQESGDVYSSDEASKISDHLKSLGYLE